MDKKKRDAVTGKIFDTIAFQADTLRQWAFDHLDTIERLEKEHGLNLRGLISLYGEDILDGTVHESRETLAVWAQLYDSIAKDDTVTLLSIERKAEDTFRRMSPIKKQIMPETFREGIMIIGSGSMYFADWMQEDDPRITAKIAADEMYYFDEEGVTRISDFALASSNERTYSAKRINAKILVPGAKVLEIPMTTSEDGRVEIQKDLLAVSYPIPLYRILKDYQATAKIKS